MNDLEPHLRGNPRSSGYVRGEGEWYVEPPRAVRALFEVEKFEGLVWDPCCGLGTVPRIGRTMGVTAYGTDAADRGWHRQPDYGPLDFFITNGVSDRHPNIVTNPPYRGIKRFIEHALTLADRKVCILARLALMEGSRRSSMWKSTPIARVHVFSSRIGCPPGRLAAKMTDEERDKQAGAIAYAWFVWEKGHVGLPTWDLI